MDVLDNARGEDFNPMMGEFIFIIPMEKKRLVAPHLPSYICRDIREKANARAAVVALRLPLALNRELARFLVG